MNVSLLLSILSCLALWGQAASGLKDQVTKDKYCLADDMTPYLYYASKTSYNVARGTLSKEAMVPEGCEAVQVWHILRHGTRYPSLGDIQDFMKMLPDLQDDIIKAHDKDKGELCDKDIENLKKWSLGSLNTTWDSILTPEGELENFELGQRMKAALPDLLDVPFSNDTFKFRHTNFQRTLESAKAFARGLFGDDGDDIYMPPALPVDPILQFYELCAKYIKEVEQNDSATEESHDYKHGPDMDEVVDDISDRLGFDTDLDDMEVLYDACRYYKAWDPPAISPWCAALTPENLHVTEYWQDTKYYYLDGYGHEINYECACPPLKDLIQHFRDAVEKSEGPNGIFYFTHSDALNKLIARLGLYKDADPLTHKHVDPYRLWRSSLIGSFQSNIVFTLSNCSDSRGYWVSTLVSERPVQLPGCPSDKGCSWTDFIRLFGQFENCDLDEICKVDKKLHPKQTILPPKSNKDSDLWWTFLRQNMEDLWRKLSSYLL